MAAMNLKVFLTTAVSIGLCQTVFSSDLDIKEGRGYPGKNASSKEMGLKSFTSSSEINEEYHYRKGLKYAPPEISGSVAQFYELYKKKK